MRKRRSFSLANCKCRTANEHWSSEGLGLWAHEQTTTGSDTLIHIGWPTVPVYTHLLVWGSSRLLSLWGKLPWISLYLPEGQRDAFAQACNIEELICDNWGTCSRASAECRSVMPLLRYCLTLGDTGSKCFCSMGRHAGPEALRCWTASLSLRLQGL